MTWERERGRPLARSEAAEAGVRCGPDWVAWEAKQPAPTRSSGRSSRERGEASSAPGSGGEPRAATFSGSYRRLP